MKYPLWLMAGLSLSLVTLLHAQQTPPVVPPAPKATTTTVAGTDSPPPPGVNSAVYPTTRPGPGWKGAHELLVSQVQGQANILFVGDSITQNWLVKDYGAEIWKKHYRPLRGANIGLSGDKTQNILWRLQNGGLGKVKPKVVVLLAGINNFGQNSAPEIVEGVSAIVTELRKQLPQAKILLLGLLPKDRAAGTATRAKIQEINTGIAKLEDAKNSVYFLDIGNAFLTPGGELTKEVAADGLHPTAKGYAIFAEALDPKLKELLGPAE